jgi:hypothetical protein
MDKAILSTTNSAPLVEGKFLLSEEDSLPRARPLNSPQPQKRVDCAYGRHREEALI